MMRINYNGTEMDVDELTVDKYYNHIKSNTYWKIHGIEPSPMGVMVDLEMVNEYGDGKDMQLITNLQQMFSKQGSFEEITKMEFNNRKQR